jgi:hypothetical protein
MTLEFHIARTHLRPRLIHASLLSKVDCPQDMPINRTLAVFLASGATIPNDLQMRCAQIEAPGHHRSFDRGESGQVNLMPSAVLGRSW